MLNTTASSAKARASTWGLWDVFGASKTALAISLAAGLLSGVGSAWMMALINKSLAPSETGANDQPALFFCLCLLTLIASSLSVSALSRIARDNQYHLRYWLAERILSAPVVHLQFCGPHKLMAALTDDVTSVVTAQEVLPYLFVEGAKMAAAFVYLAYLSPSLFVLVAIFVAFGISTYRYAQQRAMRWHQLARDSDNVLFGHFRALTEGYKELKMDAKRRSAFLDHDFKHTASLLKERLNKGTTISILANNWSETLYYVLIGVILFVSPRIAQTPHGALIGFTLVILFIGAPLATLFNAVPLIGKGVVALKNIEALRLDSAEASLGAETPAHCEAPLLELIGVSFRHPSAEDESGYGFGPLDLAISPGELVFLTGGNGSGKTTLALVILGLYVPQTGVIRLDGEAISNANREAYRQNFSAVFADSYVFDSLLGYDDEDFQRRAADLLTLLKLERKVHVDAGRFSTVALSKGERRRLALLAAYLSDRPIFLFDEWAADQDPTFREIFYRQLLPGLKSRGKTVIAITHDDRYFHLCDRLLRLTTGQLEEISFAGGQERKVTAEARRA
ncbi:MAG TPA: cyclic peptide export ABC transporter [Methylocystis sp.]|nr:cyclic peptide export ABC transporter [Methylocystis sp.]